MEKALVKDWVRLKQEIKDREEKLEQLRTIACKMMKKIDKNVLEGDGYNLVKSESTFTVLSKKDMPQDLVDKYSKQASKVIFRLVKN